MGEESVEESTYHEARVEFIKPLDRSVAEAVAQVLLYKVGVVQDVICYQGLLPRPSRTQDRRHVVSEPQPVGELGSSFATDTLWVMCCCSTGACPLGSMRVGCATR